MTNERFFNGYVIFKSGCLKDKFPASLTIGDNEPYNTLTRVNNGLEIRGFEPDGYERQKILFVPMSQVAFYEVYKT